MTARLLEALAVAAELHRNQRRKDAEASPYINHPITVARLLASHGHEGELELLEAAVLHDVIEDTTITPAELEARFGPRVCAIVLEVTNDKTVPKDQLKQRQIAKAPHLSREAKLVKLADKIANLTDILESPPASWDRARKRAYFESAAAVVAGLRGVNATLEARFDALFARLESL